MTAASWMGETRSAAAAGRILDVAAELFAEHGVDAVNMNQISAAAGCSRATLYRYFPSRAELQMAFVERAARTLSRQIAERVTDISEPAQRTTDAIAAAVEAVRADPVLHSWFRPGSAGVAAELGSSSGLVKKIVTAFVSDDSAGNSVEPSADQTLRAQFIVRIILSLLTIPGTDIAEERAVIERFVTPAVVTLG